MPILVIQNAVLQCSMGMAPANLAVQVPHDVDGHAAAAANIDDYLPNANVPPFGMCQSMSNPQVSAATTAAQGVLTPQPCAPLLTKAWSPGSNSVTIRDRPALHDGCKCDCQWAGSMSVTSAGQTDIEVD